LPYCLRFLGFLVSNGRKAKGTFKTKLKTK